MSSWTLPPLSPQQSVTDQTIDSLTSQQGPDPGKGSGRRVLTARQIILMDGTYTWGGTVQHAVNAVIFPPLGNY